MRLISDTLIIKYVFLLPLLYGYILFEAWENIVQKNGFRKDATYIDRIILLVTNEIPPASVPSDS